MHLAGAVPLQGGIPLIVDGFVVGAIGVSGASSADEDQELALLGAAGYAATYVGAGSSAPAGIAAALALGALIGALNGIGVGVFEASPLIVTLGMAGMLQGALIVFDKAHLANAPNVPGPILQLANGSIGGFFPLSALVWVAAAALVILALHRTGFGRVVYAVGDNKEACRLAGVPVAGVLVAVYALAGMVSAIGGILLVGLSRYANVEMGTPFLLPSDPVVMSMSTVSEKPVSSVPLLWNA